MPRVSTLHHLLGRHRPTPQLSQLRSVWDTVDPTLAFRPHRGKPAFRRAFRGGFLLLAEMRHRTLHPVAGPDISKERAAPHPIFTLPEGFRSRLRRLPPASGTASGSGAARRFRRGAFRSGLRPLPDSGAALRNPEIFMGIRRTCGHAITPCDSLSALLTVPCCTIDHLHSSRP